MHKHDKWAGEFDVRGNPTVDKDSCLGRIEMLVIKNWIPKQLLSEHFLGIYRAEKSHWGLLYFRTIWI